MVTAQPSSIRWTVARARSIETMAHGHPPGGPVDVVRRRAAASSPGLRRGPSPSVRHNRLGGSVEAAEGYTRPVSGTSRGPSGRFITIEGPEGAGKTSQAERLRAALARRGQEVLLTREPGGTPLGERIRELLLGRGLAVDPRADALLFNAARAQLVAEVIRPALTRGALVISTRYADSTIAYQGFGAGLPIGELRRVELLATGGLQADRTILLDLPVEVGLARKTGAELTRFEREFDVDFHRRVRAGFLEIARAEPDRFVVVDATAEEHVVFEAVLGAAGPILGLGEPDAPGVRIHR